MESLFVLTTEEHNDLSLAWYEVFLMSAMDDFPFRSGRIRFSAMVTGQVGPIVTSAIPNALEILRAARDAIAEYEIRPDYNRDRGDHEDRLWEMKLDWDTVRRRLDRGIDILAGKQSG